MSTTLKLQNTINWCKPFLKNQPLDFAVQEPALTTGNMILQTLLGAPFKWRFNRGTFTLTCAPAVPAAGAIAGTAAQADYPVTVPDFGYLEDQVVTIGSGAAQKSFALSGKFNLGRPTGVASRPTEIAAQYDDGQGHVTFRLNTMPDQPYVILADYQRRAPVLISLASTLNPIPDEFSFVFNWGFLAIVGLLTNDPRAAIWEKYFIGRLLGLQDGLDQVDIDIFLGLWATNTKEAARTSGFAQQGMQGRNV